MDNFAYADIIFFAILAAYILNRLRATLGQDDGSRFLTGNPFTNSAANKDKVKLGAKGGVQTPEAAPAQPIVTAKKYAEPEIKDKSLQEKLEAIKALSPEFSAGYFIAGAKVAFEMVMEAFNKGDKSTLKNLLGKELYTSFEEDINNRASGQITTSTLVAITASEIQNVTLEKNVAEITINFQSEQITVTKDAEGKVISGNASYVERIEDSWTFRRNLNSSNPNWTITAID